MHVPMPHASSSAATFDLTILYASGILHDLGLSYEDGGTASAKQLNSHGPSPAKVSETMSFGTGT